MKKILIISAHTDDLELACGATVAKLIEQGSQIYHVAFSWCGNNELKKEFNDSMNSMGIDKTEILNYPVRRFREHRQEILEEMIRLKEKIDPFYVFVPCSSDTHQDHQVINEEAIRAFKFCSILGYELIWNNLVGSAQCVFNLNEYHVRKKIEAVEKYVSQAGRKYTSPEFISNLAKVRGVQNGCEFAECFQIIKWYL